MNTRLPLLFFLLASLAVPAHAAQEVPVDLRPDAGAQLAAERTMKSLLDEWTATAFDVQFQARSEVDLAAPGRVKVRLDGFAIGFNADWYRRYKAFHDGLVKQPFGQETLDHALAYCRQGDGRLRATMLDGAGKVLWAAPVTHTRAPSHYAPVEAHLFAPPVRRALPAGPPDLRQLWPPPPGEVPYLLAPPDAARTAKRIRLGDMVGRRWPVDLRDPLAPPPPPPPASPPVAPGGAPVPPGGVPAPAGGAPLPPGGTAVPAGAAPRLAPPALVPASAATTTPRPAPTARVAPPRRQQREGGP